MDVALRDGLIPNWRWLRDGRHHASGGGSRRGLCVGTVLGQRIHRGAHAVAHHLGRAHGHIGGQSHRRRGHARPSRGGPVRGRRSPWRDWPLLGWLATLNNCKAAYALGDAEPLPKLPDDPKTKPAACAAVAVAASFKASCKLDDASTRGPRATAGVTAMIKADNSAMMRAGRSGHRGSNIMAEGIGKRRLPAKH